jgi:hypothetical protein
MQVHDLSSWAREIITHEIVKNQLNLWLLSIFFAVDFTDQADT